MLEAYELHHIKDVMGITKLRFTVCRPTAPIRRDIQAKKSLAVRFERPDCAVGNIGAMRREGGLGEADPAVNRVVRHREFRPLGLPYRVW